jgi:hypothetical protein
MEKPLVVPFPQREATTMDTNLVLDRLLKLELAASALEIRVAKVETHIGFIEDNTVEILDMLRAGKVLTTALRWLAAVGSALVVAWAAWKSLK